MGADVSLRLLVCLQAGLLGMTLGLLYDVLRASCLRLRRLTGVAGHPVLHPGGHGGVPLHALSAGGR